MYKKIIFLYIFSTTASIRKWKECRCNRLGSQRSHLLWRRHSVVALLSRRQNWYLLSGAGLKSILTRLRQYPRACQQRCWKEFEVVYWRCRRYFEITPCFRMSPWFTCSTGFAALYQSSACPTRLCRSSSPCPLPDCSRQHLLQVSSCGLLLTVVSKERLKSAQKDAT